MNLLYWAIIGLIAGAIAKAIMPGSSKEPGGWILTIVLGIVGALVGGFVGNMVGLGASGVVGTLITAVVGSLIVIAALRLLSGRKVA